MNEIRPVTAEQLVPISEWTRGAKHSSGEFAVISLRGEHLGLQAHLQASEVQADRTWREHMLSELDRVEGKMHEYGYDDVVIAGWGGQEVEDVLDAHAASRETTRFGDRRAPDQPDLIGLYRVEHGQLYSRPDPETMQQPWQHTGPVPDVDELDMAIRGFPPPAETAELGVAGLRPNPDEAAPPIAASGADVIANVAPSARTELALEALDRITEHRLNPEPVGEENRLVGIQTVSEAVGSSRLVRDAVGTYAAADQQRLGSLIEAYLQAPEEHREAMSSCAAGANHFSGGSTQATAALAEQSLARENQWAPAAHMAVSHAQSGASGAALHQAVSDQVADGLEQADAAFARAADERWLAQHAAMSTTTTTAGLEVN